MNIEQLRAEFEAWMSQEFPGMSLERCETHRYTRLEAQYMHEAFQAGRAALQSQDREDSGMAEIVREAAQIIAAIPPEHAPDNIRWPIVDELEGFASKIDHARRAEGEGE